MLEQASRSLPAVALHPATLCLFFLLLRAVAKTPHASGKLLLVVVWLRYVMQAYHEITYLSFGGVSINALVSAGVCCIGVAILARRLPEIGRYPIMLSLVAAIVASGLMNDALMPTIETVLKWGYFAVVFLAVADCIRRDGDARILGLLLWAFAPPLVYQALSVVLGVSKATESDGSISYIGGYNHEAAFSVVLVTCFTIAALAPRLNPAVRLTLLVACLAGIFAANYRTSLIALAPIAFGYFVFGVARRAHSSQRVVFSLIGLIVMAGAATAANYAMSDRLADLSMMATESGDLLRNPDEFTVAERQLMSGRLYIWNRYIEEYQSGNDLQLLLGFGADAWMEVFGVYAHNTLVSYLYEFGLVGAVLIVLIWLAMIAQALRIRDWALRGQLVCTHVGFILLNMATMPFWQIEGLIFYALLCGYTVCAAPGLAPQQAPPYRARWTARHLNEGRRESTDSGDKPAFRRLRSPPTT
jgi:hypothetical protein